MPSGDICPKCRAGQLYCRTSEPAHGMQVQVQYIECKNTKCDYKEKNVVPRSRIHSKK